MTHQLSRRASRASDYEAEARVLGALASDLATNPRGLLHKIAEAVLTLCRTDSAGVSVLEPGGANGVIRWHAVAGRFAPDLSGSMAREATPCGYAIARNEVMLFERAAQYFPALRSVEPPIYEILLAPWNAHGEPAGTLWAISHTPERHFDPEDARLLTSLACFASAWHTAPRLDLANAGRDEVERRIEERTRELEAANAKLRQSEERVHRALSIETLGVLLFNLDGRLHDANRAFERMSGYTREELRAIVHWEVLTPPEFRDMTAQAAGELARRGESSPYEKQLIRKDGSRWWGLCAPKRLTGSGDDAECVEFILDVTDRKRAEEELRHRSEQFQRLVDQAPIGMYLVDADFRILQVNPVARPVFGDIPDLIGRHFDEVIHILWDQAYADELVRIVRHTLATGEPYITRERAEFRVDRGVTEYYEWQLHRIPLPDGRHGVVCYFRDISQHVHARVALRQAHDELEERVRQRTLELSQANATLEGELRDRRAAEARIKALLKRLVTIQEEERRRMARDIHDQLGQQMTALRMSLESLRAACGGRPHVDDRAAWAQRLAEELDRSIDFLTWELRPASLDDLGLSWALGNLVRGWSQRFGVPAEYEASGTDALRMAPDVEANLYRLAQEALQNIYKHAAATRVSVSLERRARHVVLAIVDDGCGFSPGELARQTASQRLGLVGMRERASLAGGEIQIESSPGRGTAIHVHVPVENGSRQTAAQHPAT